MVGEGADRRDDVQRVAMRLHDQRVGVFGHQRVELPQMRGRLQQPLTRHTRLQVLQIPSMIAIGRRCRLRAYARYYMGIVRHREHHAAEFAGGDPDAFLRRPSRRSGCLPQPGPIFRDFKARLDFGDPRVRGIGLRPRRRNGLSTSQVNGARKRGGARAGHTGSSSRSGLADDENRLGQAGLRLRIIPAER